uniref:Aminotransferase-like plant mobile domain-containing protein n=1 Tax=Fagus sylvatica TaxID=28930 RepID=A0A2N9G1Y4_FAGSY
MRSSSKRQRADQGPPFADPIPEDFVMLGFRYPPQGGIRARYPIITPVTDTPLLTNLINHPVIFGPPLILVSRAPDRGGWSDFCKLLVGARREYREFSDEAGFRPFSQHPICVWVGLPLVSLYLALRPWTFWVIEDPSALEGIRSTSLRLRYLRDLLRREKDEPPTELRYRQWTAYFIFNCFLANDKSTIPTPIVGMFRDVDTLREYDWGALTYGPNKLPSAPDPAFPLTKRWDSAWIQRLTARTLLECRTTVNCIRDMDVVFQPYFSALIGRAELFEAVQLSRWRIWIWTRSWELLMGERTVRQLGGDAIVPMDPPSLMTIKGYIQYAPSDSYVEGVDFYLHLVRAEGEMAQLQEEAAQRQMECHNPIFTPGIFSGVGTQNEPIWEAVFMRKDSFQPCSDLVRKLKPLSKRVTSATMCNSSDRQELLWSSRNLDQKMTPRHEKHSNGLCSRDRVSRTQARLCARPVLLERRVFQPHNELIRKPGCVRKRTCSETMCNSRIAKIFPGLAGISIGKLPSGEPKTPLVASVRGTISLEPKLDTP